jgi:hypothetical protein
MKGNFSKANKKKWTKDEIEFVKNNYKKIPLKLIADKLNRSKTSVQLKKVSMGLIDSCFGEIEQKSEITQKRKEIGYANLVAIHDWVRKFKVKTELCENCNLEKPYDLANISGEYKKDIKDYKWLCRRCHMKDDGRIKRFMKYRFEKVKRDNSGRFIG